MRVTIDAAGRVVIPKLLRDELGIDGPAELEIVAHDGRLEVRVPDLDVTVEVDGGIALFRTAVPVPPLDAATVRAELERTRR